MHSLQKQFHDEIISKQLFQKEEKVLLAVSGGVDSMVMSHLFLSMNFSFGIAHCNFGLRGADSNADEKLVKEWAEKNGVTCHVKHFKLEGSIQIAARNARYEWFDELMKEKKYDYVATAHHLNDSFETSLFNLSRGTGIKGLSGISSASGRVIRPLLSFTKNQLTDYAHEHDILWREDASNTKQDYSRNLLRNEVVPFLKQLNPSLEETFKNTSERLQLTNQLLQDHVTSVQNKHLQKKDNIWRLDTSWIRQNIDMLILSEIVSDFGFNYTTAKEIFSAVSKSGKVFFSDDYELTIDRKSAYIRRKQDVVKQNFSISGMGAYQTEDEILKVSMVDISEVDFNANEKIEFFDAKKVQFPLIIRSWKEGDRFKPLGMKGFKKVSDYLIDKKIPLALKDDVKVVLSGNEIMWVVGYQISENFKVNKSQPQVIKLELCDTV